MSKAFDTINIHTLIRKLLQTKIPVTIIKVITNYIKGCKAYTQYRNHTSSQRKFKTGVQQCGILSRTLQHSHCRHTTTQSTGSDHGICRYYHHQPGPQNKQHCTTHGNAPKCYGPYLRPKIHIQHTYSQHLSTSWQAATNDKNTHSNRMG